MKNKRKIFINILFWLCIAGAVAFAAYPQYTKWKSAKEKEQLIQEIREIMEANAEQDEEDAEDEDTDDPEAAFEEMIAQGAVESMADEEEPEPEPEMSQIEEAEEETTPTYTPEQIAAARKAAIESILSKQKVLGIIEIDAIGLTEPVVEGIDKENLKVAAGHTPGTAEIGAKGNTVICAHNGGLYGILFKYLVKLKDGDTVVITDAQNDAYEYEVYDSFLVEPDEVWILKPVTDPDGAQMNVLTLYTCEKNGALRRVVRCKLKGEPKEEVKQEKKTKKKKKNKKNKIEAVPEVEDANASETEETTDQN